MIPCALVNPFVILKLKKNRFGFIKGLVKILGISTTAVIPHFTQVTGASYLICRSVSPSSKKDHFFVLKLVCRNENPKCPDDIRTIQNLSPV